MEKVYAVSGIDTGIGKTVATAAMARTLSGKGVDVITVKMVQTGNDGFSEDLEVHRAACGGSVSLKTRRALRLRRFSVSRHRLFWRRGWRDGLWTWRGYPRP